MMELYSCAPGIWSWEVDNLFNFILELAFAAAEVLIYMFYYKVFDVVIHISSLRNVLTLISDSSYVNFVLGFETVFQSNSGRLPERGRTKREMIDERKKCPNNPLLHLLQEQWALALLLSKLVGRPDPGSLPSTIAPPDHPLSGCNLVCLFMYEN